MADQAEEVRKRLLGDWLRALSLIEGEITRLEAVKECPTKELVEKLKITSLEIRVSLKELPDIVDAPAEPGEAKDPLDRLKLVS